MGAAAPEETLAPTRGTGTAPGVTASEGWGSVGTSGLEARAGHNLTDL